MARFGAPGGDVLATLTCNRADRTVTLSRAGAANTAIPATITTTSQSRPLSASPLPGATPPMVAIVLPAQDRLLDAMAFSRGRFALDISGLPTLILPTWAEVARVIEDCR